MAAPAQHNIDRGTADANETTRPVSLASHYAPGQERPRLVVGELLLCPYCIAQWVATGLTPGLIGAPRLTRALGTISVAHTVSDFPQVAYRAAEEEL